MLGVANSVDHNVRYPAMPETCNAENRNARNGGRFKFSPLVHVDGLWSNSSSPSVYPILAACCEKL